MSIIFTRGCEYGLQAMLYLASKPRNTPIFQRDISDALSIPPHFLGKVLQMLARSGLVVSQKGKSGGFLLAKPAKEITPYEVIQAIDGPISLDGCVLGFPGCSDDVPCPVHPQWKKIKGGLIRMLENKNLAQLSKEMSSKLDFVKGLS